MNEPKVDGAKVRDHSSDVWLRHEGVWTCIFDEDGSLEEHLADGGGYTRWSWERLASKYKLTLVSTPEPSEPSVAVKDVVAALEDNLTYLKDTRKRILDQLGIKPLKKVVRATIEVDLDEEEGWELKTDEDHRYFLSATAFEDIKVESFEVIEK